MKQLLITAQKVKEVDSEMSVPILKALLSEMREYSPHVKLGHCLVFLHPSKMSGKTSFFKFSSAKSFISVSHILTLSVKKT